MNINNLGLLNSFTAILNEGIKDSDYAITVYLVNNLDRIADISVNEIIDEQFTSRSAVRRYCHRLGYNNFSDLKDSITKLIFPSNLQYRLPSDFGDIREKLSELILAMINDINAVFTVEVINQIISQIHEYKDVILLCANNTSGDLIRFQQELIYASKEVKIVSNAYTNNENIKSLSKDSLVITVSVSGKFAEIANNWVREMNCRKILITASGDEIFREVYHQIYFITNKNFTDDYLGIYGKYGIVYIFDLIASNYIAKYK